MCCLLFLMAGLDGSNRTVSSVCAERTAVSPPERGAGFGTGSRSVRPAWAVWIACGDEGGQRRNQGEYAVPEGDLGERESAGQVAGDEDRDGCSAVGEQVDDTEEWGPLGNRAALEQAAGGGADRDPLAGAGQHGRGDEQRQLVNRDGCDQPGDAEEERGHAESLTRGGVDRAAERGAERTGRHVGGEDQAQDEGALAV